MIHRQFGILEHFLAALRLAVAERQSDRTGKENPRSLNVMGARNVLRMVSAKAVMRADSRSDSRMRPNWSPDSRASVLALIRRPSRRASVSRIELPTAMPTESLTCLKRSRSIHHDGRTDRRIGLGEADHRIEPIEE